MDCIRLNLCRCKFNIRAKAVENHRAANIDAPSIREHGPAVNVGHEPVGNVDLKCRWTRTVR